MIQRPSEASEPAAEAAPAASGAGPARITYCFGDFTFDATSGLRRAGRGVYLSPRELLLLSRLVQSRGDVVRHGVLKAALLSDFFSSDTSVYRTVLGLRRALGDRLRNIVVSVTGSGYRIGLPVAVREEAVERPGDKDGGLRFTHSALTEAGIHLASAFHAPTEAGLSSAAAHLRQIARNEPADPAACAAFANVLIARMIRGYVRPASHREEAFAAVDSALAVEPEHPASLAAKGWLCGVLDGDRYTGLRFIERSLAHDPASPRAALLKAWLLIGERRAEEAMSELDRAMRLRPGDPDLPWLWAWLLCARKEYGAARSFTSTALESLPDSDLLWICDAVARVKLGEGKSALHTLRVVSRRSPRDWLVQASLVWVWAAAGGRIRYGELLSRLATPPLGYTSPVMSAIVHRAMDDHGAVREFLRIAGNDRDPWSLLAWCDPRLQD